MESLTDRLFPHKSRLLSIVEVILLAVSLASVSYAVITASDQGIDVGAFRNIGRSWVEGTYRIYGPPPFAAVPFAFLALMSFSQAVIVCLALNLFATAVCIVLVKSFFGPHWRLRAVFYISALLLSWAPYRVTLRAGQISLVVTALVLGSVILWKRGRKIIAGLLMGFALCKFPLSLPFFLYFVLRKEWKIAATALLVVAALTGLFSLRLGMSPVPVTLDYLRVTTNRSLSNNPHFAGVTEIGPLLYGLIGSEPLADTLNKILVVFGILAMVVVFRLRPQPEKLHLVIISFFSLWYVYHRTYDSVICIIPAAYFIDEIVKNGYRKLGIVCLAALGLLAVSIPGLLTGRLHLRSDVLSGNLAGFLGLHIERLLIFGFFWFFLVFLWLEFRPTAGNGGKTFAAN